MRGGKLNKRITIQRKAATNDPDYGTETSAWADVASRIWAEVQDVLPSRSEQVRQGVRVATRPARVRIRYRAGITSDMRVIIHGTEDRTCQIVGGPAEIGRREGLELVVEEYSS